MKGSRLQFSDLAASKRILSVVTKEILAEYEEVLRRPRFKLSPARIRKVLAVLRRTSELVKPGRKLTISRDESDNRFYECAEAGAADFLITGNTLHFPVHHKTTKIVTPREFIELVGPTLTSGD